MVPLPNHEAGSVEIICNILHHRNHAVPKFLTPSKVLMVAITALSLDCIVALTWASVAWLKPADPNDLQGLSQLMAAAYVMENSQDFSKITLAMILHHNSPYCEVSRAELHLDKDVYWHIMCKSYLNATKSITNSSAKTFWNRKEPIYAPNWIQSWSKVSKMLL